MLARFPRSPPSPSRFSHRFVLVGGVNEPLPGAGSSEGRTLQRPFSLAHWRCDAKGSEDYHAICPNISVAFPKFYCDREARVVVMWSYALRNPMMAAVAGVASGMEARSGQTRQQMGHEWRKAEV